ncbi:MAG: leucine-rich repeat domain-containing protein, partial [Clostridia bacterium]|nr:leucine-rich repeat domain-containing protein [Clostridia bacterium]
MREDKFYELMGEIDPEIIAAADSPVPFRQKRGFKIALIAAVLAFAMLLTPVAGAFALAVGYIATRDHVNDGSEPQDPTQGDAQQDFTPGGLVGELLGGIDWGALKDTVGADGNVNWKDFFAVLQGNPSETVGASGHAFQAVKLDDGTMKITKFVNNGNETIVEIPETISGAKVTVIGEGAFKDNPNITHVSIPDTVTIIEQAAFFKCENLLTVDLGEGVQEIGKEAFLYCSSLTAINLPDTLHTLGMNAFGKCKSLTKIDLPAGLTGIPAYAFYGTPLTEISIPATVISIGDYAFANCTELSKVTFDTAAVVLSSNPTPRVMGVEYIGEGAFENTAISSITFPYTLTDIYDIDFKGCMNLEQVIFTGNAPTVHKEPSADKSAPDNQNAPDYTVYYMLSAQGFSKPEWHGYASQLMAYPTEQFVKNRFKREHYTEVPMYNVEVLGQVDLPWQDEVTVIDSYSEYEAFAHVLTSARYDREYFEDFAIVLIHVQQCSSEQVLGHAGIGAQLYI